MVRLIVLIFGLVVLVACGPNCPDDPAYRWDPKTNTCIDLGKDHEDEYDEYRIEQVRAEDNYIIELTAEAMQEDEMMREAATDWARETDLIATEEAEVRAEWAFVETEEAQARVESSATGNGTPECLIKGNVSFDKQEKIYHMPGCEDYDVTVIDSRWGERWFCTEDDAKGAGWRKAKNCPP